jgi:hypothetical protein
MNDEVDSLLIEVRAGTEGFSQGVKDMRREFDATLVEGLGRAGDVLERGLLGAIRKGSLGFDDLRRIALGVINDIAAQAVQTLFAGLGAGGAGGAASGLGGILGGGDSGGVLKGLLGSLLGLPGRATGGPVAPGRGYVVGERGPELFVPTAAGRIVPSQPIGEAARAFTGGTQAAAGSPFAQPAPPRDVRVAISIASPPGSNSAQSLQRSSRQVASAVRRALSAA